MINLRDVKKKTDNDLGDRIRNKYEVTIIGPAIVDILAGPIGEDIFSSGTMPMEDIQLSYGGNGYNEATILSRLGISVNLISKVGSDEAGKRLVNKIESFGINAECIVREEGLSTSINIVLFDEQGERRFLTNPKGSQRRLSEKDIMDKLDSAADIVCFSCMFISPLLDIQAMQRIFGKIKDRIERTLIVDMTKAKNGETIKDLQPLLKYIDFIFPNEEELKLLSGGNIDQGAKELLDAGVGCVIVKLGKRGCKVFTSEKVFKVDAFKVNRVIDTTGAGDCFAAGFIYGLSKKKNLLECVEFAIATASCCVECIGATEGIVSIEEPMKRYELLSSSSTEE